MTYLIESSSCLIVFYTFYFLLLRHKSFHAWNRFFLLGGLLLSLIIPALSFPVYETIIVAQNTTTANISPASISTKTMEVAASKFDWLNLIKLVYLSLVFIFLIGTIREVIKILIAVKESNTKKEDGIIKVFLDNDLPTSSFFNYLFIPSNEQISPMEYRHELAHIEQWHSLDKLLLSIMKAIFWFNPVIYFYKKSLDELHEYLADQAVIDTSSLDIYLAFLKDKIERQYQYALINPFYSLIKNRLTMIKNESKSSRKIILLIIPICIALFGVFACEEYQTIEEPNANDASISNHFVFIENSVPDLETILSLTGHFDPNEECECLGLNLLYAAKGKDIIRVINSGSTFNKESTILISNSKAGDKFLLDNIQLNCKDSYLNSKQVIFTVENRDSKNLSQVTIKDTITYFNEETYEETIKIIDRTMTQEEYIALLQEEKEITGSIENTIIEEDTPGEKKYLLSSDTIIFFDEDTYEETVRVVSNYTTKEIYDAYQDAKAKELYIYFREQNKDERLGESVHYEDVSQYLKTNANFLLEENKTYVYEILERGKVIETSTPFKLSDLK